MIRVGINGFGRIGRALARIIYNHDDIMLVAINDIDPLIDNHAYLLKYDSIYGRFNKPVEIKGKSKLIINNGEVRFYAKNNISQVPWHENDLDVVIDSSGTESNVLQARKILNAKLRKVVITHSSDKVDSTIVLGANECAYNANKHHVVSSSICDATAIAPVLNVLNEHLGIKNCFVTTLHPWLSYQNVLDGSLVSVSSPGHYWQDYGLGRSSVGNLIPKDTTAAKATIKVLPVMEGKLDAMSFRTPTHIVASSDITVFVKRKTSKEEVNSIFKDVSDKNPRIFGFVNDHLVSLDYLAGEKSAFIDGRWTKVMSGSIIKVVIWYDNEWGYSSRVLDIVRFINGRKLAHE